MNGGHVVSRVGHVTGGRGLCRTVVVRLSQTLYDDWRQTNDHTDRWSSATDSASEQDRCPDTSSAGATTPSAVNSCVQLATEDGKSKLTITWRRLVALLITPTNSTIAPCWLVVVVVRSILYRLRQAGPACVRACVPLDQSTPLLD